MIRITVDEGYAFDFHSIAAVKAAQVDNAQNAANLQRIEHDLVEQIGDAHHRAILVSEEYANLYAVNLRLYNLVDAAKKDLVKASEVDRGVYDRWLAKKVLQEKFFPEIPLQEQKIGYVTK